MSALLSRTNKFQVWGLNSTEKSDAAGKIIVGGRKVPISDVLKVACQNFSVVLENSFVEKLENELLQKLDENQVFRCSIKIKKQTAPFPVELCKAMLFARVVSLLQEKSGVRVAVTQVLINMLNAGIVPCFTDQNEAGSELVAILTGIESKFYVNGSVINTNSGLSALGIKPVMLTETEGKTLLYGQFSVSGACSLIVGCVSNIFQVVDVLASYSCEAVGAPVEAFDSALFDVNRPHRGQMASATNLRLMLEGSKCTNTPDFGGSSAYTSIPQVHGPVHEALTSASKMMELELNSSEGGPVSSPSASLHPAQSYLALSLIDTALRSLLTSSSDRQSALSENDIAIINFSSTQDLLGTFTAIKTLSSTLASELLLATIKINSKDGGMAKQLSGASTGDAKDSSETTEKAVNFKSKKPTPEDDSQLTPEQRAKAEAKRKEKALKAEQKAKAKEAKKGSAGALVLGIGTTLLRTHLLTKQSSSEPTLQAFTKLIDPFDNSDTSFTTFCVKLMEQISSGGKHKPKIPKGARDFGPEQMRVREQAFAVIRRVFKRHGAVEIDTPVFELREVLMGKYGEDSKLIYDLADQGGELLSLRYDLTVPFARFLAMNSVGNIKRFHIAKVYRRDNPQLSKGRYREFYQCDFDIAGSYPPMVPDAEVITVATEILSDLPIGQFMIKLNHRGILDAVFEICGVPAEKFRTICSAVDKLDKSPWTEVRKEMVEEKGLAASVADRIGEFVLFHGEPMALWEQLSSERKFGDHAVANTALADLRTLFGYLDAMGSLPYVHFDLSLARGLDYYTGVIYEVVLIDSGKTGVSVGSIAAGGRYDNLVGMFSASGQQTPCVGVSIGIERVFAIMEKKALDMGLLKAANVQVFVASIGAGLVPHRMRITKLLWEANISAEYAHQENPKFKKQLDEVLERGIPFMVVFGEEELSKGTVKVKAIREHYEAEVSLDLMVPSLMEKGCVSIPPGADLDFLTAMKLV